MRDSSSGLRVLKFQFGHELKAENLDDQKARTNR